MCAPGFGLCQRVTAAIRGLQPWQLLLAIMSLVLVTSLVLVGSLVLIATTPAAAQAQELTNVWRSPQFGLKLTHPTGWTVTEQRSDPERGDVVILGNETSALLVGLLHDTRTPHEMADDLVLAQKSATPDLAVLQSNVTETGAILMFMQYTIQPHTDAAMLIDEKALVGALQPGVSTITVRGMVPDRANVVEEFEQIETMIGSITPDR
jgi:hypothetical protein